MITDKARMDGFEAALRQAVKPGSVVLDIGTGTGIFSLLACRFGARKVYAIEPDNAIQLAREIAAGNGYANRIEFFQKVSTDVVIAEPADVIISDIRGVLPLFQNHLPAIADARKRLLKPGATMIAQKDTLWAAFVEAPQLYDKVTVPWAENKYGLDMRAACSLLTNTWRKGRVTPEQFLAQPQCWATIDYTKVKNPDVKAELDWITQRAGTAHGIIIWFDSVLAEGIEFSNAPGKPELIYGSAFFPLSQPVTIAAGDRVSLSLQANLVGEDYIWGWNTSVLAQGDAGKIKANFRQSTFFGAPLSATQLHKRSAAFVPSLNDDGKIDFAIIDLMNSGTSLGQIADKILKQFPRRFGTTQQALTRVGELSLKYSKKSSE